MGSHKLLLPWGEATLIDHVLGCWAESVIDRLVIIVRRDDELLREAIDLSAVQLDVVYAEEPTAGMVETLRIGIQFLADCCHPTSNDFCFVAPADLPQISPHVIDTLASEAAELASPLSGAVLPVFGQKQGHPVLLPWDLARQVDRLPEGVGLDQMVASAEKHQVCFPAELYYSDVDTPEDYRRALRSLNCSKDHENRANSKLQ